MSEFFLELFSEEIPSNLQQNLREDLLKSFNEFFLEKTVLFKKSSSYSTPNRLVVLFEGVQKNVVLKSEEIKGPNTKSPELALEGFIRSNKILKKDIDKDGYIDIVVSGNMYNSEVETPRNDGSVGLFLKFDPESGFQAIPTKESGLFLNGDVKDMEFINLKNNDYIISAKNNDLIEFTRIK